jgi:hypothetical protein
MTWLRRLIFGAGRLPEPLRTQLLAEDVLVFAEGLFGSVTYRRYRAPGRRTGWSRQAVSGAVALTANRLVVWAGGMKHIDVPLAHPIRATIEARAEAPNRIRFTYDAGVTNTSISGNVDVWLRTEHAARIAELLATRPAA